MRMFPLILSLVPFLWLSSLLYGKPDLTYNVGLAFCSVFISTEQKVLYFHVRFSISIRFSVS